jgi:hypothetical protein
MLLWLADWLDLVDRYIAVTYGYVRTLVPESQVSPPVGDQVQEDLRRLAARLPADLDARLMDLLRESE